MRRSAGRLRTGVEDEGRSVCEDVVATPCILEEVIVRFRSWATSTGGDETRFPIGLVSFVCQGEAQQTHVSAPVHARTACSFVSSALVRVGFWSGSSAPRITIALNTSSSFFIFFAPVIRLASTRSGYLNPPHSLGRLRTCAHWVDFGECSGDLFGARGPALGDVVGPRLRHPPPPRRSNPGMAPRQRLGRRPRFLEGEPSMLGFPSRWSSVVWPRATRRIPLQRPPPTALDGPGALQDLAKGKSPWRYGAPCTRCSQLERWFFP